MCSYDDPAMRLIQKLERKLSFRRKQLISDSSTTNFSKSFNKNDKENVESSSIKVSETEFSGYIRFNNCLVSTMSVPDSSYKLVDIKIRNRCEPIRSENLRNLPQAKPASNHSDNQHSLYGCKEMFDKNHIYDVVGQPSLVNHEHDYYHSRNRIRTNPWYNSRSGLNIKQSDDIHHYEYIDWEDTQDVQSLSSPISGKNLSTFDRPIHKSPNVQQQKLSSIIKTKPFKQSESNVRLKKSIENPYEQLPYDNSFDAMLNHNYCTESKIEKKNNNDHSTTRFSHSRTKLIAAINNKQKQINNDHSNCYKRSPYQMKFDTTNNNNNFCLKRKFIQNKDDISSSSSRAIKRRKNDHHVNVSSSSSSSPALSKKRSRKIDRLKFELKEIVHVAIREAKNEDSHILF